MRNTVLGLLAAASFVGPAQAAIVYSNNFDAENGGASALNYSSFSGLTVTEGFVDLVATPEFGITCAGGSGSCVDLDGSRTDGGTLATSALYSFNAGDTVTFSVLVSGDQRRNDGGDEFVLGFDFANDSQQVTSAGFDFGGGAFVFPGAFIDGDFTFGDVTQVNDPFSLRQVFFTAAEAGSVSFVIGTSSDDNVGPVIDNVSLDITAVPEPASWAMMIAGFGLVGAASRRRVRTSVTYA